MTPVLFVILDTASHLNASFKMANALKSCGHHIVYLGKPSSKKMIKQQGFDFLVRSENFQPEIIVGKVVKTEEVKAILEENFLGKNFFEEAISQNKPGLILLDTSLIYYAVHLLQRNIPIITVSTKVCQDKTAFVPPFQSSFIPFKRNILSWLKVECIWILHLLRKKWKNYRDNSNPEQISWVYLVKKYLKQKDYKVGLRMNLKRSSHLGLENTPELILSPRYFDFHRSIHKNKRYIGPVVDVNR
jgi:hypothetical protein